MTPIDAYQRNGYYPQKDKYNEKYIPNRIEYKQNNYCDPHKDFMEKRTFIDLKSYSMDKMLPQMEPRFRSNLLSPPLPDKGKRPPPLIDQPRSLDSTLSIVESHNEINRPGPQTPIHKKYSMNGVEAKTNMKNIRENFIRSTLHQNDVNELRNGLERQSLRFTTTTQKLLVNGKIANAVHNGKISPPSRKANLVRTPSDVVRKISYSSGIHHAEPIGKLHAELLSKSPPSLPPHCPPTSHQLSQSKASYLSAYRREPKEKGLPQGSYKRTMSPSGGRIIDTSVIDPVPEKENDIQKIYPSKDAEMIKTVNGDNGDNESTTSQENNTINCDKETLSKTLPRNYSLSVVPVAKRAPRPPRAQSDPTSTKVEKKSVSASTQDNLDEAGLSEEKGVVTVNRSLSEGAERKERGRMSDASSQTTPIPSPPPPPQILTQLPRRQLQEEIECEQLSRDLASQLSPSHRLHGILAPGPEVKRSTDYVSGLFRMDLPPRQRSSPINTTISSNNNNNINNENSSNNNNNSSNNNNNHTPPQQNGKDSDILSGNNAYYTTSECKARLMSLVNNSSTQSETINTISSLQQKKEELMQRLTRKLSVLKSESVAVSEETSVNEALGTTVTERVERVARPHEVAKFRLHVKEVGHITSLLLGLSGRLARAENALLNLPPEHHDRKILESKRDKLLEQLNEAKQLKSNIDKRSESVSTMLYNYLTGEEYTDYDHFINMKSKLLVDSREIAEKIQLGEEQLAALKETLDQVR